MLVFKKKRVFLKKLLNYRFQTVLPEFPAVLETTIISFDIKLICTQNLSSKLRFWVKMTVRF